VGDKLEDPRLSPMLICQWLMPAAWAQQVFFSEEREAKTSIEKAIQTAQKNGLKPIIPLIHLIRAMMYIAAGDGEGAQREATRAQAVSRYMPNVRSMNDWVMMGTALLQGKSELAVQQGRLAWERAKSGWMTEVTVTLYLSYAECVSGNYDRA